MDNYKICFITAVKNEEQYSRCLDALSKLIIPDGYSAEVVSITQFKSIAEAYNEGRKSSDAQYKVYLKEDTIILNKKFISDILNVFNNNWLIGIIGVSGTKKIPTDLEYWNTPARYGKYLLDSKLQSWENEFELYKKVEAIDEQIIITSHDIPWREDLLQKEGLLALSQSIEYKRRGYYVTVAEQRNAWCSVSDKLFLDEVERERVLDEYSRELFPLVSILMLSYNRPGYFEVALKSALAQTYRNIEIVIGDDSTNNEVEAVVRKYQQKYDNIIYLNEKNPENPIVVMRGLENLTRVLHHSKGEYINYLNDDDLFHKDKIAKMMNYYLFYEGIGLVTSYRQTIDKDGLLIECNIEKLSDKPVRLNGQECGKYMSLTQMNFIGEPTTVLLKKSLINETGMGEYHKYLFTCNGDMATWFSLLKKYDMIYIPEALSYFRVHPGQNQKDLVAQMYGCADLGRFIMMELQYHDFKVESEALMSLLNKWVKFSDEVEKNISREEFKTSKLYTASLVEGFFTVKKNIKNILDSNGDSLE